ncbi:hypothetical protein LTR35_004497 [Friedmanniomyces endolithicus]|nr:hypothetical protein LTR35_004497 [Friedmanniomyces endolithicus]KAK0295623.1 hypothetical protein LTS00_005824 [Friedmanniomyces endolithicus]KAK0993353.1 hypothetical protein LTR54_011124 [Friedmanniomyces endolithicus]
MSRSMKETPMDFEYQNRTGPMDSRSGFARVGQTPHLFSQTAKKRDYDAYDSPPKFSTNHLPSPSKPLPPRPVFNSLFSTPRRTNNDIDDSSAGETPRSPEQNNDSDATPDTTNVRNALIRSQEAASMPTQPGATAPERPSPQKSNSWITTQLTKAKHKFASPGRGEIARADHTSGMEAGVQKRRKREIHRKESRRRRHSMSDSNDSDDNSHNPRTTHLSSPRKPSTHSHQTNPEPPERKQHWLNHPLDLHRNPPHRPAHPLLVRPTSLQHLPPLLLRVRHRLRLARLHHRHKPRGALRNPRDHGRNGVLRARVHGEPLCGGEGPGNGDGVRELAGVHGEGSAESGTGES